MEITFNGKRALVTGASRGKPSLSSNTQNVSFPIKILGIGREIVKNLAKCGAQVIAVSRDKNQLGNKSAIKGKQRAINRFFREPKG